MNNIQLSCSGNCLTKPLYCWSLLDVIIVVGVIFIIIFIIMAINEAMSKNRP